MFSRDEAERELYATELSCEDRARPEDRPVIFPEATIDRPWGWVFFYNNAQFFRTRNTRDLSIGPGPIFFNKETGKTRVFSSGGSLVEQIYDYEAELAAGEGHWCLWLRGDQDRLLVAVRLKILLSLTTKQAASMIPTLPVCLFDGSRRHLEWLALHIRARGVACSISIESKELRASMRFELPERLVSPSPAQAFHAASV